jgi:hypothetical protein
MSEFLRPVPAEAVEQGTPVYKPYVQFESFGLIVGFDHALQASPEQLVDDTKRPDTAAFFAITADRDIYLPRDTVLPETLTAVANGLQAYLSDESLSDEQRSALEHGVARLQKYAATGNRTNL